MKSLYLSFYLLLFGLVCFTIPRLSAASPAEIAALIALYDATDGDNWVNNTNWKNGMDPCDVAAKWYGVTCDGSGNVTKLILQSNGLNGSIPTDIGDLIHLVELSFSWNDLSGSLPLSLTNITGLRVLKIYANQISGNLPPEIGDLVNLTEITLSYNQLEIRDSRHPGRVVRQRTGVYPVSCAAIWRINCPSTCPKAGRNGEQARARCQPTTDPTH